MSEEASPGEVVRRILGGWNTDDPSFVHRYYDEDFRFESSTGETTDRTGYRQVVAGVHDAFDDLAVDTQFLVAEDDRVVARVALSGTHAGEFRGVPATGEDASFDPVFVYRVRDGRVLEEEHHADNLGLLQQLGAVEGP